MAVAIGERPGVYWGLYVHGGVLRFPSSPGKSSIRRTSPAGSRGHHFAIDANVHGQYRKPDFDRRSDAVCVHKPATDEADRIGGLRGARYPAHGPVDSEHEWSRFLQRVSERKPSAAGVSTAAEHRARNLPGPGADGWSNVHISGGGGRREGKQEPEIGSRGGFMRRGRRVGTMSSGRWIGRVIATVGCLLVLCVAFVGGGVAAVGATSFTASLAIPDLVEGRLGRTSDIWILLNSG